MKFLKEMFLFVLLVSFAASSKLHKAVQFGDAEKLRVLLAEGADVNEEYNGWTPLMYAIYFDRKECFDIILEQKDVKLDAVDENGNTALHFGAEEGNKAMCRDLLDKGANVNAQNDDRKTAHALATINKNFECAEVIQIAEMLSALLEQAAQNNRDRTALMYAILNYEKECFDALLKRKDVEVNAVDRAGNSALHFAASIGNEAMCRDLLGKAVNVDAKNKSGKTPYDLATIDKRVVCAKMIQNAVSTSREVNKAARNGDAQKLRALLKKGANVNTIYNNATPLMKSIHDQYKPIYFDGKECFDIILENKDVEVDVVDEDGNTALHLASEKGNEAMCRDLLEKGANVNAHDTHGETPLMKSIYMNKKKCFDVILKQKGVDVDAVDEDGNTALHFAAKEGNKAMCMDLLENGANFNAKNNARQTAHKSATLNERSECAKMILIAMQKQIFFKIRRYVEWNGVRRPFVFGKIKI